MSLHVKAHQATTDDLAALYPFAASHPPSAPGAYIGSDTFGGGTFCYDAWQLQQAKVITGPNACILGAIGNRKSTLAKTMVIRQVVFGRRAWIFDRKGEYGDLARHLGCEPIRLEAGGRIRLNVLEALAGDADSGRNRNARLSILRALVVATLGRELTPQEGTQLEVALDLAVAVAARSGIQPTLTHVMELVLRPPAGIAELASMTPSEFYNGSRQLAHALRRLVLGDLAGLFDGPTSGNVNLNAPVVVFDLSALGDRGTLGLVMLCVFAWMRRTLREERVGERILVIWDEAWRVLREPGAVEFMQESWKLARSWGVQNVAIMHRLADLRTAGNVGTGVYEAAIGLLADSETKIVYRQDPQDGNALAAALALSRRESELIQELLPGDALWKIGKAGSFVVRHEVTAKELQLVDTDQRNT